MIIGTHNSATSGRLVWWLRPFAWLLHLTSRCQNRTIEEQLQDGVRLFNLQVCMYNGEWYISHGLCIYEAKLLDILDIFKKYKDEKIIIQIYLDKNFFVKQDEKRFYDLIGFIKTKYCSPNFILQIAWIEGTSKYPHRTSYHLNVEEHYWTKTWAFKQVRSWINRFPLPKYHARTYNKQYIDNCKSDYLMLDFYNIN